MNDEIKETKVKTSSLFGRSLKEDAQRQDDRKNIKSVKHGKKGRKERCKNVGVKGERRGGGEDNPPREKRNEEKRNDMRKNSG